jgi:hypothetical protein
MVYMIGEQGKRKMDEWRNSLRDVFFVFAVILFVANETNGLEVD